MNPTQREERSEQESDVPRPSGAALSQAEINLAHYGEPAAGRSDYWRLMAAPRFRTATILRSLAEENPSRILDIGCGDGTLLSEIHERMPAAQLAGLDLSPGQIAENRLLRPTIEWIAGPAETLQETVPAGRYNAVVASELIEHLADPEGFLRNVRSIIAPGGLLVLSTQSGRVGETERRVGHLRHFTSEEMKRFLVAAGWQPVRVWNAGFPFQDLSKYLANLAPDYSMHHFGERPYGLKERLASLILRILFRFNSQRRGAQLFAIARNGTGGIA
ncbi:MAG TPA: class I SAM-dependent methyltransferase [Thermoanaerobaculia bacterium]|nr:class I SAM-dependent methyltransferase [Thermoanaerobaculia bacterium]